MAWHWETCPHCGTFFQLDDAHDRGRALCPACGGGLVPPGVLAREPEWYYVENKRKVGPVALEKLRERAAKGLLQPRDMVLRQGTNKWQAASSLAGIFSTSTNSPCAGPAPPATPGASSPAWHWEICPQCQTYFQLEDAKDRAGARCPTCGWIAAPTAPVEPGWHHIENKKKVGPVSFSQLQERAAGGRLRHHDMVLPPGASKWSEAASIEGLFPAPAPGAASPSPMPGEAATAASLPIPLVPAASRDEIITEPGNPFARSTSTLAPVLVAIVPETQPVTDDSIPPLPLVPEGEAAAIVESGIREVSTSEPAAASCVQADAPGGFDVSAPGLETSTSPSENPDGIERARVEPLLKPEPIPELAGEDLASGEQLIRRFERAWLQGKRPELEDFLPADTRERRRALTRLVPMDLEFRLKTGEPARIDAYFERYPELTGNREHALDLIQAEFRFRERWDPDFQRGEIIRRFPQFSEALAKFWKPPVEPMPSSAIETQAVKSATSNPSIPQIPRYESPGELGRGRLSVVSKERPGPMERWRAASLVNFFFRLWQRWERMLKEVGEALKRPNENQKKAKAARSLLQEQLARLQQEKAAADKAAADYQAAVLEGYRKVHAGLVECGKDALSAETARALLWSCVLASDVVNPAEVADAAEKLAAQNPKASAAFLVLHGAALYRAGRFDAALLRLNEALERAGSVSDEAAEALERAGSVSDEAAARLFLSMTHHRLENPQEARQWLDKAEKWIDEDNHNRIGGVATIPWTQRLEIELLHREAAGLVKK